MKLNAVSKFKAIPPSSEVTNSQNLNTKDNQTKKLSVIIVSYNTENILKKALTKVYQQKGFTDFEVIVVDNNSHDGSCAMVKRNFPQAKLICSSVNGGFAAGNNIGIEVAIGDYILLLNSDAFVFSDSFKESIAYMDAYPKTGIMGVQLVCEDGSPQMSACELPTPLQKFKVLSGLESRYPSYETYFNYYKADDNYYPEPRKVGWVPGAYFFIRREVVEKVGILDNNFFMYYEEVDYCNRTHKAGWDVIYNPNIAVIHLGGASSMTTNKKISRTGRQLVDIRVSSEYYYYRKNSGFLTMLLAAGIEIGWKSLICIKNLIIKDSLSQNKFDEAKQAIELVWLKIKREVSY